MTSNRNRNKKSSYSLGCYKEIGSSVHKSTTMSRREANKCQCHSSSCLHLPTKAVETNIVITTRLLIKISFISPKEEEAFTFNHQSRNHQTKNNLILDPNSRNRAHHPKKIAALLVR